MKYILLTFTILLSVSCMQQEETKTAIDPSEIRDGSFPKINLKEGRYNVALLLIEGTYNTELTAPMDIFHHTRFREGIKAMNVFTVSNTYEPVRTFEGLEIIPDFNYLDSIPRIDILVIPAAENNLNTDLDDIELIEFIKSTGENANFVCSHCDGAFLLAKTGLLDDRSSTTFPGDIEEYKEMFPDLDVKEDVLFVHDGKYITSAGGAKSFEASLYLTELLYGKKIADELAEGMVIDWKLEDLGFLKIEQNK